jgi:zinc-ribbon domain
MFCHQCGSNNLETVSYCIRCGASLTEIRRSLTGMLPESPGLRINLSLQQILRSSWWTSVIAFLMGVVSLLLANSVMWPTRGVLVIVSVVIFLVGYLASNAACLIALRRLEPLAKNQPLSPRESTMRGLPSEPLENRTWAIRPPSVIEATTRNLGEAALPPKSD